jgi:hypothetical protein
MNMAAAAPNMTSAVAPTTMRDSHELSYPLASIAIATRALKFISQR